MEESNVSEQWIESMPEKIWFLDKLYISDINKYFNFREPLLNEIICTAQRLNESEELKKLVWNYHCAIFKTDEFGKCRETLQKELSSHSQDVTALFSTIVLLSGFETVKDYYREKGISEKVLKDTMADLPLWIEHYYDNYKTYGLNEFNWLLCHFRCKLFKLGRLQFMAGKFHEKITAFQNIESGELMTLSHCGIKYRQDGLIDGTSGIYDDESWESIYTEGNVIINGNPILNGYCVKESIKLDAHCWRKVFESGDNIIEVHIPAGEKMDFEKCVQSYELAKKFYKDYFPEKQLKAFVCESWILDPRLQNILPEESNIVRFQKYSMLFPMLSTDSQTIERVFSNDLPSYINREKLSILQRGILDFMNKGNKMCAGGMYILL
jgi:hypothetical protein